MTQPPFDTGDPGPGSGPGLDSGSGAGPGSGPGGPPGFGPPVSWQAATPLAAARDASRRRFLLVMAAFGLLLVVSAVGFVLTAGGDVHDAAARLEERRAGPITARPLIPERTLAIDGPVPEPVVYRGTGPKRLRIRRPEPGDAIVRVRGRSATGLFTVTGFDANGVNSGFVVAEIGSYDGERLLDVAGVLRTESLEIEATGPWVVEVRSARSATAFTGSLSGTGDRVVRYDGPAGTATIRGGDATSAFLVTAYANGVPRPVVVSVGAFAGRKPWPAGPALVEVRAPGRWSIRL